MGGDGERDKRTGGGEREDAQAGAQGASASPTLAEQVVAIAAQADAWYIKHPELVTEFNQLIGGCAGGRGGINLRALRGWQADHGVRVTGILDPATMARAREISAEAHAQGDGAEKNKPHADKAAAGGAATAEIETPPEVGAAIDSGDPKIAAKIEKPEQHAAHAKDKRDEKPNNAHAAGDQGAGAAKNNAPSTAGAAPAVEQSPEDAQLAAALAQPVPDLKTEYDSLVGLAESQLGRELKPAEINRLMALTDQRVTQMQERRVLLLRKQREQVERRMLVEQLQRGMTHIPDDEAEKKPSFWKLAGAQAYDNMVVGSVNVLHGLKEYLLSVGDRSLKLQKEMRERGMTNLGSPLTPVAVMAGDSLTDISKSLQGTTDAIERCLEAERGTDKAIAAADALLGLGKAGLAAYAIVEPVAGLERGGPVGGARVLAAGAEGAGGVAVAGKAAAAVAGDGARLSHAGILRVIEELLGEGPETAAVNETGKKGAGMAEAPKHHVFPQEHREWFEKRGFKGAEDIDNFTVQLDEADHQAIHGGGNPQLGRKWPGEWNTLVMDRLKQTERALGGKRLLTVDEIQSVVEQLMDQYNIPTNYVPYK